ncbi:hypothetical protein [Cysteiniphilum litorale]|uniref:Uncharacterized protein n=2 Tax=Cysteiniphilum TaxID=2056696 RepID=A0A8J3E835_9GAMM|nr:hypothetical protein [Cysteiniphilum litorale]GGF95375.1 hypothetical protein GCM10010995_10750 [Cysteiniphilum litorale]
MGNELEKIVPELKLYFDGTFCNKDNGKDPTVVGEAYNNDKSVETYFNREKYDGLVGNQNILENQYLKIYFPGPAAERKNTKYDKPGTGKFNSKYMSQHTTNNSTGLWGDGWEHNMQLALIIACNFIIEQLGKHERVAISIPASHSRGAITAIAFSNQLSYFLQKMGIDKQKVSIRSLYAIDPVAGLDYGALEKSVVRNIPMENFHAENDSNDLKNHLVQVEPIRIGAYVDRLTLRYAADERRTAYKSQLPYGIDPNFKNGRPLFIPDNVDVEISYSRATHQTIAYTEKEGNKFFSGKNTLGEIQSKNNAQIKLQYGIISEELVDDLSKAKAKVNSFHPKEDRVIKIKCKDNPECKEKYTNSVLHDVYQFFMHKSKNDCNFFQAFNDPKNKYYDLINWAYKNSAFYQQLDSKEYKIEPKVLAHLVQIKQKDQSKNFAKFINSVDSYAKSEKNQNLSHNDYKDAVRQAINSSLIHIRPSSSNAKKRKLERIRDVFLEKISEKSFNNSKDIYAKLLYLAERVVQHNMGKLHFRLGRNYSKDYDKNDFKEAKDLFLNGNQRLNNNKNNKNIDHRGDFPQKKRPPDQGENNHYDSLDKGGEYRKYGDLKITFANFDKIDQIITGNIKMTEYASKANTETKNDSEITDKFLIELSDNIKNKSDNMLSNSDLSVKIKLKQELCLYGEDVFELYKKCIKDAKTSIVFKNFGIDESSDAWDTIKSSLEDLSKEKENSVNKIQVYFLVNKPVLSALYKNKHVETWIEKNKTKLTGLNFHFLPCPMCQDSCRL